MTNYKNFSGEDFMNYLRGLKLSEQEIRYIKLAKKGGVYKAHIKHINRQSQPKIHIHKT